MSLTERSDEDLMQRLQGGTVEAFDELFTRYKTPLLTFLVRYTRDNQRAEDLFQQVFLKVFQNASGFQGQSTFRTWLFSIAVNAARDLFRKEKLRQAVSLDQGRNSDDGDSPPAGVPEPEASGPQPVDIVADHELTRHLETAIDALDDEYRAPFVMARFNGLSYQEIADSLHITVPTVRMRIHRAHRKLTSQLARLIKTEETAP